MNRRSFMALMATISLASVTSFANPSLVKSPLFYQVDNPTFLTHYTIEGKGIEPALQQRSFVVQTFRVKTSFKEWVDTMRKDNHVVVYDWWVQEAPTAPFDSAVMVRAALLNKSIPYVMTDFHPRFDYTLDKKSEK